MLNKVKKFFFIPFPKKLRTLGNAYCQIKTQTFYKVLFKALGSGSVIKTPLYLTPEHISIGENCYIWNDARIEGVSNYAGDKFEPHIIIEDGVTIQQRCHITAVTKLLIGRNSLISFNVTIQDTDHEYHDLSLPVGDQPLVFKKTLIGEGCFIGSGAKIQAGTILGTHCIVGANAVVRGIFPNYSVIVGVPAKIVKRYNLIPNNGRKQMVKEIFYELF